MSRTKSSKIDITNTIHPLLSHEYMQFPNELKLKLSSSELEFLLNVLAKTSFSVYSQLQKNKDLPDAEFEQLKVYLDNSRHMYNAICNQLKLIAHDNEQVN
jgi:hypothetical protein